MLPDIACALGHAGRGFRFGSMLEGSRLHLLAEQLLIDQSVEDVAAILVGELVELAAVEQRLVAQSFVPVALQNDVPVDLGDDAVDDLASARRGQNEQAQEQRERGHRSVPFVLPRTLSIRMAGLC